MTCLYTFSRVSEILCNSWKLSRELFGRFSKKDGFFFFRKRDISKSFLEPGDSEQNLERCCYSVLKSISIWVAEKKYIYTNDNPNYNLHTQRTVVLSISRTGPEHCLQQFLSHLDFLYVDPGKLDVWFEESNAIVCLTCHHRDTVRIKKHHFILLSYESQMSSDSILFTIQYRDYGGVH